MQEQKDRPFRPRKAWGELTPTGRWKRLNPGKGMEYVRRQNAAGLCKQCSRPLLANIKTVCEHHLFANVAQKRMGSVRFGDVLKEKLIAQGYRCALSGTAIVPGVNASLDHILPTSQFPERAADLSNVQWVSTEVNYAKRTMTPERFVEMCAAVVAHNRRAG